ncbi:MAG: ABC transporter permease [Chloroflexi bacterium]|nr:MAG: ABC transporter permease [Chloroflexota bacterium]
MLYRLWMLMVKELLQLARNKLFAPLVLIGPLLEMSLIAWSTSAPIQNLPTAVVDLDRSAESRALLTALENTRTFDFTFYLDNPNDVTPLIEHGKATAGIIIPAGYSRRLTHPAGDPPQVAFLLDGADPISANEALNAALGVAESLNQQLIVDTFGPEAMALSPVQTRLRVRYNEEMKKSVYTVPSELGLMLFAVALMIAGISIARERELGTLEQLMTTPIRRFELVVAKSVPAVLLGYLVFLGMLAVAITAFGIPMRGSWPLLLATSFFFILVELGIGLMISAYARNQNQGLMLGFTWVMIEFFFSGYGVPVENMPEILRRIAPAFPIYHYMIIFRSILLKGVGIDAFWPHLMAGLVIGTVVMSTAIWLLGRQKWE